MFGSLGFPELIVIFVIALIIFGPRKLPEIGKSLGKSLAEFKKASGILSGLWEKVRERPDEFLDLRVVDNEGLDAATRDFVAGMTDRYAVSLYEQLFIPKPWTAD